MAQVRPPVRPTQAERRQPLELPSPLWCVEVVAKDTRRHVANYSSPNFFKALHMKNWFIDNGVPGHPLGRPGAIEVLLDRLPPIPTDLEPDDVAPALALALAIATGATASEEVA